MPKRKPSRAADKLRPIVGRLLVIDACRVCYYCHFRAGFGDWKCAKENRIVPNPHTGIPRWCPLPKHANKEINQTEDGR